MIKALSELSDEQKSQFIDLYYESFILDIDKKRKHEDKLKSIFGSAFLEGFAAAYIEDERVAGLVAYSNNKHSALKFDKQVCKQQLGKILGDIQHGIFEGFFGKATAKGDDEGYIDFLAVHEDYRRRGIATKLLEYAYAQENKPKYILGVMTKNEKAKKLYVKQGYVKYEVKKSLIIRIALGDTVDMMRLNRNV